MRRVLGVFGIVAFILIIISITVFSYLTPGYSHLTNAISELGINDKQYALEFNIFGFGIVGLLVSLFSYGLYQTIRQYKGSRLLSIIVFISGISWGILGIFSLAPNLQTTFLSNMHYVFVSINYLSFIVGVALMAIFLRKEMHWKNVIVLSIIYALIGISTFIIPTSIIPGGIIQRIAIFVYFAWILTISIPVIILERQKGST